MWVQVMYPHPLATNLLQSKTLSAVSRLAPPPRAAGVAGGGPVTLTPAQGIGRNRPSLRS